MRVPTMVLLAIATLCGALTLLPTVSAESPRVGVLVVGSDPEDAAARAGLLDGLKLGGAGESLVRSVGPEASEAQGALTEMRQEGVRVVVAIGAGASVRAHATVRDRPIVVAGVDATTAVELHRGGDACVAGDVEPDGLLAELRRLVPGLERLGVFVPDKDAAAAAAARELGRRAEVVVAPADRASASDPAEDAAALISRGARAVWLPPSVSSADAAAIARKFEGRGVPLVGSRRAHLGAGCALVVRAEARDVGALAAVLAVQVLADADPGKLPIRRTSRRLVEVDLVAARRLSFQVPLTLLARADEVLRPRPVPR